MLQTAEQADALTYSQMLADRARTIHQTETTVQEPVSRLPSQKPAPAPVSDLAVRPVDAIRVPEGSFAVCGV